MIYVTKNCKSRVMQNNNMFVVEFKERVTNLVISTQYHPVHANTSHPDPPPNYQWNR